MSSNRSEVVNQNLTENYLSESIETSDYNMSDTKDVNMDVIKKFWIDNEIQVHGRDAPMPVLRMSGNDWLQSIRQALEDDGFTEPTPIQCQGWPIVISGRDMVGVAQTGSGKTLCYVLPAFVKIVKEGTKRGPK